MEKDRQRKPVSLEELNRIRRLNDLKFSRDGKTLFWVESIDGKGVIFRLNQSGQPVNLSKELDVRGTVGYGGGEFDVGATRLVFAERNGGLFQIDLNQKGNPQAITHTWGSIAAPAISRDEQWTIYVYQQGEVDSLAIVRMHGLTWPIRLVMGADFYMQPTWHPSGEMIAWSEWNHPYMPWDASCVKIGMLGGMQSRLLEENWIDGKAGSAASQPRFSPDGKWLSYIHRDRNWDSLILFNIKNKLKRTLVPAEDFHLCLPNWIQGMRSYAWSPNSRSIYYFRYQNAQTTLWEVNLRSGKSSPIDIQPVSWATQIECSTYDNSLAFLGTTTSQPIQVWKLSGDQLNAVEKNEIASHPQPVYSESREINFTSNNHGEVHGIYFPPVGASHSTNSAPALILNIHGGPTSQDYLCFSSEAAYFTSRGYAYAQINYRGSSGYGYKYQEALKHNWGVVDVKDTLNFTEELVRLGLADRNRLVLKGSSAGGFTALNILIRKPGVFRAAICSYPVGNLVDDAQNTHKFERFYHRFLTGDLKKNYQRFVDRSPVFHVKEIHDPVAFFHGDNDKVVSPSQSVEMFEQLTGQGVPCTLKIYEGEGHGFRKTETLKDYYQRIEAFLELHLK